MTSVPMSSMVCMTDSWEILYGFTRQSSRSTPASTYFWHISTQSSGVPTTHAPLSVNS